MRKRRRSGWEGRGPSGHFGLAPSLGSGFVCANRCYRPLTLQGTLVDRSPEFENFKVIVPQAFSGTQLLPISFQSWSPNLAEPPFSTRNLHLIWISKSSKSFVMKVLSLWIVTCYRIKTSLRVNRARWFQLWTTPIDHKNWPAFWCVAISLQCCGSSKPTVHYRGEYSMSSMIIRTQWALSCD